MILLKESFNRINPFNFTIVYVRIEEKQVQMYNCTINGVFLFGCYFLVFCFVGSAGGGGGGGVFVQSGDALCRGEANHSEYV